MVTLGHELRVAAVAHALALRLQGFFGGQRAIHPGLGAIGDDGHCERIFHGLAGGGVDGDPVGGRVAIHFVPGLHGEFGELAGFAVDDAGAEFGFIEEDLQAHGIVADGFHVQGRGCGDRLDGSGLHDRRRRRSDGSDRGHGLFRDDGFAAFERFGVDVVVAAEWQGAEHRADGWRCGRGCRLCGGS